MDIEESACLKVGPFGGEDANVTLLHDRFLITRKEHECLTCLDTILPRKRMRARTERDNDDNTLKTFYFCWPCCEAMAADWNNGNFDLSFDRAEIGVARARQREDAWRRQCDEALDAEAGAPVDDISLHCDPCY